MCFTKPFQVEPRELLKRHVKSDKTMATKNKLTSELFGDIVIDLFKNEFMQIHHVYTVTI